MDEEEEGNFIYMYLMLVLSAMLLNGKKTNIT
jgi:hypothetical protein